MAKITYVDFCGSATTVHVPDDWSLPETRG